MDNTSKEEDQFPYNLSLHEYYNKIHKWHINNHEKIFEKFIRTRDTPYIKCYQSLIDALPVPTEATEEDIVLICREVISGLMEWAYHEKDENDIKISEYAHYLLGTFFDGFNGRETIKLSEKSQLYKDFSFLNCLNKIRSKDSNDKLSLNIDISFEQLFRTKNSNVVKEIIKRLLEIAIKDIDLVIDYAIKKIKEDRYDGSKWSSLAFTLFYNLKENGTIKQILEELVTKEPENPAYLNNLGVYYFKRNLYSPALEYFARAYAIDYKYRGHKEAISLPAWKNLLSLKDILKKLQ